jgi:hypothetical protein
VNEMWRPLMLPSITSSAGGKTGGTTWTPPFVSHSELCVATPVNVFPTWLIVSVPPLSQFRIVPVPRAANVDRRGRGERRVGEGRGVARLSRVTVGSRRSPFGARDTEYERGEGRRPPDASGCDLHVILLVPKFAIGSGHIELACDRRIRPGGPDPSSFGR